jgi:hypothetical protein
MEVKRELGSGETPYYSDLTTISLRCKGSSIYGYHLRYLGTPSPFQKDEIRRANGVSGTEKGQIVHTIYKSKSLLSTLS